MVVVKESNDTSAELHDISRVDSLKLESRKLSDAFYHLQTGLYEYRC